MTRVAVRLAIVGATVGLLGSAACSDGAQTVSEAEGPVHIESISPSSGTIGTEVVIRGAGFDANENDIGFTRPDADRYRMAFKTGIPSPDGQTLRFEIEETLGACAFTQLDPGSACPSIGLLLPIGELEVGVYNRNGTSNSVRFIREVSLLEAATDEINQSPEYSELTKLLDEVLSTSYESSGAHTASYGIGIREEDGEVYIEVGVHGAAFRDIRNQIPSEIAGYEIRLD
jgi:hypothetical protein